MRNRGEQNYRQLTDMLDSVYSKSIEAVNLQISNIKRVYLAEQRKKGTNLTDAQYLADIEKSPYMKSLIEQKQDLEQQLKQKKVNYKPDYMPHIIDKKAAKSRNIVIDAELVGRTGHTKPNKPFVGFMEHQGFDPYVPDLYSSMAEYEEMKNYLLAYTPAIHQIRNFTNEMRVASSSTKKNGKFISWLDEYANQIAKKTDKMTRGFISESENVDKDANLGTKINAMGSRSFFRGLAKVQSRVSANKIAFSLPSATSNYASIANVGLYVQNPATMIEGLFNSVKGIVADTESKRMMNASPFLKSRNESNKLNEYSETSKVMKVANKITGAPMDFTDRQSSSIVWQIAYADGKNKGIKGEALIEHADDITRRCLAGRGTGEVATYFNSNIGKILSPFTIEPNETWQSFKRADLKGKVAMQLMAWGLNEASMALFGKTVGLNIIGSMIRGFADGDDDETILQRMYKGLGRTVGNMINNNVVGSLVNNTIIPTISPKLKNKIVEVMGDEDTTRYGGGDVGINALVKPASNAIDNLITGNKLSAGADLLDYAYDFAMPWGGGAQLKRAVTAATQQGLLPRVAREQTKTTKDNDGNEVVEIVAPNRLEKNKFNANYNEEGELRFPMEDNSIRDNIIQYLFGSYNTKAGQKYEKPLSYKNTKAVEELFDNGVNPSGGIRFIDELSKIPTEYKKDEAGNLLLNFKGQKVADGKSNERLVDYVTALGIPQKAKQTLYNTTGGEFDVEAYEGLKDKNKEAASVYAEYIAKKKLGYNLSESEDWKKYDKADKDGIDVRSYAIYKNVTNEKNADVDENGGVGAAEYAKALYNLDFSNDFKKYALIENKGKDWAKSGDKKALDGGLDINKLLELKQLGTFYADKDKNGKAISGTAKNKYMKAISEITTDSKERNLLAIAVGYKRYEGSSSKKTAAPKVAALKGLPSLGKK